MKKLFNIAETMHESGQALVSNVAKEMVRVTRPHGRIVMGNWIPGDPTLVAQILKICSAYTSPPPEGFISPMLASARSVPRYLVKEFYF